MRLKIVSILFLAVLIASNYGFESGSSGAISRDARTGVKVSWGNPEEVNTYTSETYWSETWWYWTKGMSFTFGTAERNEQVGSGCNRRTAKRTDIVIASTYKFNPIK